MRTYVVPSPARRGRGLGRHYRMLSYGQGRAGVDMATATSTSGECTVTVCCLEEESSVPVHWCRFLANVPCFKCLAWVSTCRGRIKHDYYIATCKPFPSALLIASAR